MSAGPTEPQRTEQISKGQPIEDDRLPQLNRALDPLAMMREFAALFARDYPDRALDVTGCEILRVYHKPGKACRIVYRVEGRDEAGATFDRVFWTQFSVDSAKGAKLDGPAPEAWPGCAPFKPLSPWPSIQASIHAFPHDRKLAHLGPLADPEHVRTLVNERRAALQLNSRWTCRGVDVHVTKYMPGSRCVLRYDLELEGPGGERLRRRIFGKTYRNTASRYVFDALRAICESLGEDETDLDLPRPIAHLDDHHTFWQEAWEGEPLRTRGERLGWTPLLGNASGWMARTGRALARLHAVPPPPGLKPGPAPEKILANAAGDAADILAFLPERRDLLMELVDTLTAAAPEPGGPPARTLIHGTFKVAQILCRDDGLAIVDFDSVAAGDPMYDVAEFVASLVYLQIKEEVPAEATTRAVSTFLAAYEDAVSWPCHRQHIAWYVVAFLLGKIHSTLKRQQAGDDSSLRAALGLASTWLAVASGAENGRGFQLASQGASTTTLDRSQTA